jgi:hypothetical protein
MERLSFFIRELNDYGVPSDLLFNEGSRPHHCHVGTKESFEGLFVCFFFCTCPHKRENKDSN